MLFSTEEGPTAHDDMTAFYETVDQKGRPPITHVDEHNRHSQISCVSLLDMKKNSSSSLKLTTENRISDAFRRCLSPSSAMHLYVNHLSHHEQTEIFRYKEIYFVGPYAKKITTQNYKGGPGEVSSQLNREDGTLRSAFDDKDYSYIPIMHDHLVYRYEILRLIGQGSFGQVLKCFDHKNGTLVAVKIIKNQTKFVKQATEEVRHLRYLMSQDPHDEHHVVRFFDSFVFRNHICLTFELLHCSLFDVLQRRKFCGLPQQVVRKIALHLLQCLAFLRCKGIVHCDLKPENILLTSAYNGTASTISKGSLKVIDFGSSCRDQRSNFTYIQSRYYRAPEVILLCAPYSHPIDIWSFAAVVLELLSGSVAFPGNNEFQQMALYMEVLGIPPSEFLKRGQRSYLYFNSFHQPLYCVNDLLPVNKKDDLLFCVNSGCEPLGSSSYTLPGRKSFSELLLPRNKVSISRSSKTTVNSRIILSLLESCLQWIPNARITPDEALEHPWFTTSGSFGALSKENSCGILSYRNLPEEKSSLRTAQSPGNQFSTYHSSQVNTQIMSNQFSSSCHLHSTPPSVKCKPTERVRSTKYLSFLPNANSMEPIRSNSGHDVSGFHIKDHLTSSSQNVSRVPSLHEFDKNEDSRISHCMDDTIFVTHNPSNGSCYSLYHDSFSNYSWGTYSSKDVMKDNRWPSTTQVTDCMRVKPERHVTQETYIHSPPPPLPPRGAPQLYKIKNQHFLQHYRLSATSTLPNPDSPGTLVDCNGYRLASSLTGSTFPKSYNSHQMVNSPMSVELSKYLFSNVESKVPPRQPVVHSNITQDMANQQLPHFESGSLDYRSHKPEQKRKMNLISCLSSCRHGSLTGILRSCSMEECNQQEHKALCKPHEKVLYPSHADKKQHEFTNKYPGSPDQSNFSSTHLDL